MTAVRITDLVEGDEVYGYMRLGLAIFKVRRVNGYIYGQVPSKPQRAGPSDLTRWQGSVRANNIEENVLTCQVTATTSDMLPVNRESYLVDLHYSSFSRLRLISKINFEPRPENHTFPANFEDAAFKPYRTFTEVLIPSYVTGS
jgi:hypothetical protein